MIPDSRSFACMHALTTAGYMARAQVELLRQDKVEWLKDAALQTTRQWLVSTVLVQPTWWLYDKAVGTEKTIGPSSQFVFLPLLDVRPLPSLDVLLSMRCSLAHRTIVGALVCWGSRSWRTSCARRRRGGTWPPQPGMCSSR